MSGTSTTIFGYGSLMEDESLRSTVPNARNIKPAFIKGFRREFSKLDSEGWTESNLDLAGIPMCAVDVVPVERDHRVNGVTFEVGNDYFKDLVRRETDYKLVETTAYSFETSEIFGTCFVFSCGQKDGKYLLDNPAQDRYLQVCLRGAKMFGNNFYKEFLATTYIGSKPLDQMPDLMK